MLGQPGNAEQGSVGDLLGRNPEPDVPGGRPGGRDDSVDSRSR